MFAGLALPHATGLRPLCSNDVRLASVEAGILAAIHSVLTGVNQSVRIVNILNSRNENIDKKLFINM